MDKFKEETAKQRISYQTNETAKHGPKRMAYWGTGNIEREIKTKKEKISIRGNNKKSVRPPHIHYITINKTSCHTYIQKIGVFCMCVRTRRLKQRGK